MKVKELREWLATVPDEAEVQVKQTVEDQEVYERYGEIMYHEQYATIWCVRAVKFIDPEIFDMPKKEVTKDDPDV